MCVLWRVFITIAPEAAVLLLPFILAHFGFPHTYTHTDWNHLHTATKSRLNSKQRNAITNSNDLFIIIVVTVFRVNEKRKKNPQPKSNQLLRYFVRVLQQISSKTKKIPFLWAVFFLYLLLLLCRQLFLYLRVTL